MFSKAGSHKAGQGSALRAKILGVLLILSVLLTAQGPAPALAEGGLHFAKSDGLSTNTCLSWAQACDLQTALTWPVDWPGAKQLWVARGVYVPTKNIDAGIFRSKTFALPNGAEVYGGFAGTESNLSQRNPRLNPTILSGDLDRDGTHFDADNAYHVVYYQYPTSAVLDGFTITAGYANGPTDDPVRPHGMGGGLYSAGNVAVKNVTFTDNWAKYGGGMWLKFHGSALTNLTFNDNYASLDGGGLYNKGTSPVITNATFDSNSTAGDGGGIFNDGGAPTLRNVTFFNNGAENGGAIANSQSTPAIYASIFWDDDAPEIYNVGSVSTVVDSIVQDGCPDGSICTNVIDADPLLQALAYNGGPKDYTKTMALGAGSAAIDAGGVNSACPPPSTDQRGVARPSGAACDIGAYEAIRHTISGNVSGMSAADVVLVDLAYNDGGAQIVHPDSSGDYSFTVPDNWTGTVTPSEAGFTFAPDHRDYTNVTSDDGGEDYVATAITYTISGTVSGMGSGDLQIVNLSYDNGGPQVAHPDASGDYSFTVPWHWTGTVTPSLSGYTFTPTNRAYAVPLVANQTAQNYAASVVMKTISGNVSGLSAADVVTVSLGYNNGGPQVVHPDSSGNYSISVPFGWSGTVTPTQADSTFAPDHRDYVNVTTDQTGHNYAATHSPVTISGTVSGMGCGNLQIVNLSYDNGGPQVAHPDCAGNYSFTVPYNWSGTVTPSLVTFVFDPDHRNYANVTTNQTGQDYAATDTTIPLVISGTVSGTGCGNLQIIDLSYVNGGAQVAHPDCAGNYSFSVPYNWSGTVTPTLSGYGFIPDHRDYSSVKVNTPGQDYLAIDTSIALIISGTVSGMGSGNLQIVNVSYDNGGPQVAHPNSSGDYSFTVPWHWTGTVTPSLSGFTFTPTSRTYAVPLVANQTAQNYAASVVMKTISGNVSGLSAADVVTVSLGYDNGGPQVAHPDSSGNYSISVPFGWSGTVTPTRTGSTFAPDHRDYVNVTTDQTGHNYVATAALAPSGPPLIPAAGIQMPGGVAGTPISEGQTIGNSASQFFVQFDQDVYDPAGDTDPNDVTNPANFLLVRDDGDGFQTASCQDGIQPGDTAITIDAVTYDNTQYIATIDVNSALPLSNGIYRLFVCGTTSIVNALDHTKLAGDGSNAGTDFVRDFIVSDKAGGGGGKTEKAGANEPPAITSSVLPTTGFAPGAVTLPGRQPAQVYAASNGVILEIPVLSIQAPIVGVVLQNGNWQDLAGLGANAGYLEGSAFPTWPGNTVLTGHVVDSSGAVGIFSNVKDLEVGDKVYIHGGGKIFIYEVRDNRLVFPSAVETVFRHETYNWVTLVTCENWSAARQAYTYRRMVRAVLISVMPDK